MRSRLFKMYFASVIILERGIIIKKKIQNYTTDEKGYFLRVETVSIDIITYFVRELCSIFFIYTLTPGGSGNIRW